MGYFPSSTAAWGDRRTLPLINFGGYLGLDKLELTRNLGDVLENWGTSVLIGARARGEYRLGEASFFLFVDFGDVFFTDSTELSSAITTCLALAPDVNVPVLFS